MSESMADFEKEIDESLKTLNVVENEGEAPEEETGFNAWDKVQQYLEDGTVLSLKIGGIVNKGVIVYVDGLRGFIPASHLEIGYVEDTNPYLGKTVEAKVITADPEKNRLVLSVKEVLYDKKRAEKEQRINAIEAGAVLTGKVESLMPYGAFIDLGGVDGLLHISEMSWGRTENPKKVYKVGDSVKCFIKEINGDKIALSVKYPDQNPWNDASTKYAVGNVVTGKVARMTDFGAFVQLEDGIDALLHVSQISKEHINKPEDVLKIGQEIEAKVVDLNEADKKISLSMKALLDDAEPQEEATEE